MKAEMFFFYEMITEILGEHLVEVKCLLKTSFSSSGSRNLFEGGPEDSLNLRRSAAAIFFF